MDREKEVILDFAHDLFLHLEDTESEYAIKAAAYFVTKYGFNKKYLPENYV